MNQLHQILAKLKTRPALIAMAVALVVLNIGRLATNQYNDYLDGIESKNSLLEQYHKSTKNIDSLRKQIQLLEQKRNKFETRLFTGENRKEITSAMQIKIQELLGKTGLNPESLRPTSKGGKSKGKKYGEVIVKVRLTGSLEDFVKFLTELYKLNYLFKIDNFTLKPFKKKKLKVFLELKGFYKLPKEELEKNK